MSIIELRKVISMCANSSDAIIIDFRDIVMSNIDENMIFNLAL